MSYIRESVGELKARISKAKGEIAILEKCVSMLEELAEEPEQPEAPPGNSHEDEPSEPIKPRKSGFVGVYPVMGGSKKWYATVTERGKTKRLCGTHDKPEEANTARTAYLAKRDGEPERTSCEKRTFGPSDERHV